MNRHNNSFHKFVRGMVKAKHDLAKQSILDVLPTYREKTPFGETIRGKTVKQISFATQIPRRQVSGYLKTLKVNKFVIYTKGTWKKRIPK